MNRYLWCVAVMVLSTGASARDVVEALGERTARFFASDEARAGALPSYALLREAGGPPGDAGVKVTPRFTMIDSKQGVIVEITAGTSLYGTGEAPGQLLRNGRRTVCWNTDAYGYGDEAPSLYQSHPWVLAVRPDGTSFGVLADTTYRCVLDTAFTSPTEIRFIADGPSFPVIVIERDHPAEVVRELARLTGYMPLPPRWAIGYHQCRYSYFPESRVREIARTFREKDIPCDVIWFDIDYYESFRCFTFDRSYFPDPRQLNSDLLKEGFHNVWMINPGIKSREEPGPSDPSADIRAKEPDTLKAAREAEKVKFRALRESGLKAGVYVTRADGKVYEGEVWPGWCYFPDFTDPKVRSWWGPWYREFLSLGVTGVWNDMNEPAVFNVKSKTMPEDNRHAGDPTMRRPDGSVQGEASRGDHARYHNVYGMQMIKATREGIQAAEPDKRPFVLSRANFIGGQRYGATWTGDNSADWYHLESSIPMALNIGLSGQPFIGPDIGGFAGNGDGALFARWMGIGSLLPFARGHTGKDNIDKEPWAFGPKVEATCREALQRRYRLLPYLYTLFREASVTGLPVARPTFFADPTDSALRGEDDSFLLGGDVLVVASCVPDGSRVPVMPRGRWCEFWMSPDPDLPRLYMRGGSIVPVGPTVRHTGEKPLDPLTLLVCLDEHGKARGTLYEDAGEGYAYQKGEYSLSTFEAGMEGGSLKIRLVAHEGTLPQPTREMNVVMVGDGK
jgi:alpha-glucosidase